MRTQTNFWIYRHLVVIIQHEYGRIDLIKLLSNCFAMFAKYQQSFSFVNFTGNLSGSYLYFIQVMKKNWVFIIEQTLQELLTIKISIIIISVISRIDPQDNMNIDQVDEKKPKFINKDIMMQEIKKFQQTQLNAYLCKCLQKLGFMSPTPIQYFSLVTVLKNPETNVIAQSKSGTGKTLAFLGILLQKFINFNIISNQTHCLIVLPTRQLAIQIYQTLKSIIEASEKVSSNCQQDKKARKIIKHLKVLLTIGGMPIQDDKKNLVQQGSNIVIGTIGRIYQLIKMKILKTNAIKTLILDEGDKIFESKDSKFDQLIQKCQDQGQKIQFLVYSATFNQKGIEQILKKFKKQAEQFTFIQTLVDHNENRIQIVTKDYKQLAKTQSITKELNQSLINLDNIKKFSYEVDFTGESIIYAKCKALKNVLGQLNFNRCLIFVQKKALIQQISQSINQFDPLIIHGSLSQSSRLKLLNQANHSKIIITSDLLSRGIDLFLDLIILFDAQRCETFWHRIGRTGRYGKEGVVVTLQKIQNWKIYNPVEINMILKDIKEANVDLNQKKEWYGKYMTQYGNWHEVDQKNEEQIQKKYNFYVQQQQQLQQEQNKSSSTSKKSKKIQKQDKSKSNNNNNILQEKILCKTSLKNKQMKQTFKNQKQFLNYYKQLFQCQQCKRVIKSVESLTSYKFQIDKYMISE